MSLFGIPTLIAGILLQNNPQWFHGAHTTGVWLFWLSLAWIVINLLLFVWVLYKMRDG